MVLPPGINLTPYNIYKKCPRIVSFLSKIFQSSLKLTTVAIHCRVASDVYIPKITPLPLKVPGFWEHICIVWKELKAANTNKLQPPAV